MCMYHSSMRACVINFNSTQIRMMRHKMYEKTFKSAKKITFSFGKEKLVAPLIAIPNVDKANRTQEKGKKLN